MSKKDGDPDVLEYRAREKQNAASPASASLEIAAGVLTAMGGFSFLLLMDGAEKLAAILSAAGMLFAFLGMRDTPARRLPLIVVAALAAMVFAVGAWTTLDHHGR